MSLREVKVFDANGKLKRIISPKELSEEHWDKRKIAMTHLSGDYSASRKKKKQEDKLKGDK